MEAAMRWTLIIFIIVIRKVTFQQHHKLHGIHFTIEIEVIQSLLTFSGWSHSLMKRWIKGSKYQELDFNFFL